MTYRTILKRAEIEIEIKKSRFIGHASPAETVEEAEAFIEEIKGTHPQATHNCSAYIVGQQGINQRYSDDGEPQGTAGIPMLEVLRKEEVTNTVVVVTRYFGGVKLGASGLVRAYGKTAKEALEAGQIVVYKEFQEVAIEFSYSALGKVDHYLQKEQIFEAARDFTDKVSLTCLIHSEQVEKVQGDLLNITSGDCGWQEKDVQYLPVNQKNVIIRK